MSFLSSLFGGEQSQAEAEANIARQKKLLADQAQRRLEAGEITQDKFNRDMEFSGTVGGAEDVGAAWREGFGEGWQDGIDNNKKTVNGIFSGMLKAIPISVWIIAAIAAFVYLGGLKKVKESFA